MRLGCEIAPSVGVEAQGLDRSSQLALELIDKHGVP